MARTRTLAQLRSDIQYQGSIASIAAGSRHPTTNLDRLINQSWQRFRLKVSKVAKLPHYLTNSTPAALTPGAVSVDEPYTRVTHGLTDIVWIRQVSITVNDEVRLLEEVTIDAIGEYGKDTDEPTVWTSENATTLLLMPPSDGAYKYTVRYLPVATDLSADGDTVDGVAGFEDWIVFDVLINMMLRDDEPEMAASFQARRDEIWADIAKHAIKGRAGPHKRRDVRGMRRGVSTRRRWANG